MPKNYLSEDNNFDAVYQIERTDPVEGGPGGVSNEPHQNLTNRTKWLQVRVDALLTAIGLKAPLDSPAFTGSPTAPTPTATDNSTKLATTAFVKGKVDELWTTMKGDVEGLGIALGLKAPLNSPAFTGTPTAPTPPMTENSTRLATTEFAWEAVQLTMNKLFPMLGNGTDSFTLPNGLTLKWGTISPTATDSHGFVTITFPSSFSTKIYHVIPRSTPITSSDVPVLCELINVANGASFKIMVVKSDGTVYANKQISVNWFAIGY